MSNRFRMVNECRFRSSKDTEFGYQEQLITPWRKSNTCVPTSQRPCSLMPFLDCRTKEVKSG